MNIRGIQIETPVVLAPMAGVTSLAYRLFMKPFGVGLSVSEMISDCGLVFGNERTFTYFASDPKDRPVAMQLFGFSKENTLKAIDILEANASYDMLDINLGCPVHKVVKTGAGSAWLKDPEALYSYMKAIVERSHRPVSAKIRLGWDEAHKNVWEVAKLLEQAGVSLLSVHARTSVQGYSGTPDWECIRGLGKALSIPLCVSGDIYRPEDALRAMEIAGASLVMVARGGLGQPTLVTNIVRALKGEALLPSPSPAKQAEYALEFARLLKEEKGEKVAGMELRGLAPHFFSGFRGYKKIRTEIALKTRSYDDVERVLLGIESRDGL